jgi:7-carboxy-7-deazaguanine synthase
VISLGPTPWVTLSGGNPLLYELADLVSLLHDNGYNVAVETQGTIFKEWIHDVDMITVSPKPPSAETSTAKLEVIGKIFGTDHDEAYIDADYCLKFVIDDYEDLEFAAYVASEFPGVPAYVQPCAREHRDPMEALQWLTQTVLQDPMLRGFIVLPQLHKLLGVR